MPLITTGFRGLLPACYYYESDREERARLKQEDIGILLGGCQLLSALKSLSTDLSTFGSAFRGVRRENGLLTGFFMVRRG